jgi:hypothetical protein
MALVNASYSHQSLHKLKIRFQYMPLNKLNHSFMNIFGEKKKKKYVLVLENET